MSTEYKTFMIAVELLKREMTKGHCRSVAASLRIEGSAELDVAQFLEKVAEQISRSSDVYIAFLEELRRITVFKNTVSRVEQFYDITSIICQFDSLKERIYLQLIKDATVDSMATSLLKHCLPEKWIKELRRIDSLPHNRAYSHRQRTLHNFWMKLASHITAMEHSLLDIIIDEIGVFQKPRFRSSLIGVFNTLKNQVVAMMEKTSIKELTGYPLDQTNTNEFDYVEIKIRIQPTATLHTLKDLDMLKNKYCEAMHLPSKLFILTFVEETSPALGHDSLITVWKLPAMFAPKFTQHAKTLDDSYYVSRSIVSIDGPNEFRREIKPKISFTHQWRCTVKMLVYVVYLCFAVLVLSTVLCGVYDISKYIDYRAQHNRAISDAMEYSELKKVDLIKALIKAENDVYYVTFSLIILFVLALFTVCIACVSNVIAYKNSYAENEHQVQVLCSAVRHWKALPSSNMRPAIDDLLNT